MMIAGTFLSLISSASAQSVSPQPATALFEHPVSESDLGGARGAFSPSIINVTGLTAYSLGNSADGSLTGNNFIGNNSFNGTQGLVNVIQNSGNNVIIQSATSINVTLHP